MLGFSKHGSQLFPHVMGQTTCAGGNTLPELFVKYSVFSRQCFSFLLCLANHLHFFLLYSPLSFFLKKNLSSGSSSHELGVGLRVGDEVGKGGVGDEVGEGVRIILNKSEPLSRSLVKVFLFGNNSFNSVV